ncbi:MAG: hypothetical protein WCO98_14385 [bacterium]
MKKTIKLQVFKTKPLDSFSTEVNTAFGLICQYIDELCLQDGSGIVRARRTLIGSESWGLPWAGETSPVLIKALPWDQRMPKLAKLTKCNEGVAILLRNDCLSALNMQALYDELGDSYLPSPDNDLFATINKPFQLIIFCIGPDCNLLSLPGTNMDTVKERINDVYLKSEKDSDSDSNQKKHKDHTNDTNNVNQNINCDNYPDSKQININHNRLAGILGDMANASKRMACVSDVHQIE